ncbi:MAG: transcription elongation factor GreA [Patescibacteria group bacterium]|nr:transcription elongation factor GreA [Patescibacteria group bacterium]
MPVKKRNKKIKLTKKGYEDLKQELDTLVNDKLPKVVDRISKAREKGDLSENSEYQSALEDKDIINARISEIEDVLEKAEVVNKTTSKTKIGIGSQVKVHLKDKPKQEMSFTIVGQYEGDADEGKISTDSPLGEALLDKKVGEEAIVDAPAGEIVYIVDEVK